VGREILIVWAGRRKRDRWEALCASYRQRVARQATVRDLPIRVRASAGEDTRRRQEGEAMMAALPQDTWSVALDSGGTSWSSQEFAEELSRWRRDWPHAIAFLLGSDLGLDRSVLDRSRRIWSLGPLTLPHELARLVVYEQVYRALSIAAGIKYHRQPL
jgi:23S rRNA (pseudouridine1915-N3)-methyltransferase